jgi:DNA primase
MQVKVAVLPEGSDPADIISKDSSGWKEIIKNSLNIVSFHIDRICKNTTDLRIRGEDRETLKVFGYWDFLVYAESFILLAWVQLLRETVNLGLRWHPLLMLAEETFRV